MDNWTNTAAIADTPSPQSATLGLHPIAIGDSIQVESAPVFPVFVIKSVKH